MSDIVFTVTADVVNGVTITITEIRSGEPGDTFLVSLSVGQTLTTTLFEEGQEINFNWNEFNPTGPYNEDTREVGDQILVELNNQTRSQTGTAFTNLTNSGGGGVPCFVAASQLLTSTGYKSAKDIKTGDLLMTADGRQVPVKAFSYTVEKADKESAPFLISKNSISMGCPNVDLKLSPWHAFQMKKGLWMKPMSAFELGMPVKQYDLGKSVTYYHFEAPDFFKDNFVCDGTVVESFGGLQTKDFKGRVYTYNANLKGYTRAAGKSVSKTIMM
jgi:hypothetical protein